ncbi:MAG TPA: nitrilase-related carbon-nitrogen hydrolase [Acidobacteriota bacterium]|nr:nitrilase-related carbon-nitrogen hydrolase [Acidobacteriota bacterium]
MKIALIQQAAGEDIESNLQRGLAAMREAAARGAQLVAFAELAFRPFFPQHEREDGPFPEAEPIPGPTTEIFSQAAKELGVVTVLNLYQREGEERYDSSPVIDADGKLLGVTRMVHILNGPCFHETDYYHPGDTGAPVYDTAVGKIGVAICYDRHFPEYMRALGVKGAELVVVPQAGAVDEWTPGLFEAEMQIAALQNGYFTALVNRVGREECLEFAGESFVTDPSGLLLAQAPKGRDHLLLCDIDLSQIPQSPARRHFLKDRRPDVYPL